MIASMTQGRGETRPRNRQAPDFIEQNQQLFWAKIAWKRTEKMTEVYIFLFVEVLL